MANFYNRTGVANGKPNEENSLILDYSANLMAFIPSPYYKGIHLEAGVVIDQANGQTILNYSNIDLFEITGTKSDDILIGGDYDRNAGNPGNPYDDDQLYGGDGNDRLEGRGGDDRLSGGKGDDTLIGGDGKDELFGDDGDDIIYGGAGDNIRDDNGNNQIYANEAFMVTAGAQTTLHADYSGANYINGIRMGIFNGRAHISNGIDGSLNFDGGMAFDINGSQQDDVIGDGSVLDGNDSLYGNGGNDVINAWGGNDFIDGGLGNDSLSGGAGVDIIYGEDGDDMLDGGKDNDTIDGGQGNDILDGGQGNDTIDGGQGNDILVSSYGDSYATSRISERVNGGDGDDTIYAVAGVEGAHKDISGGDGANHFVLNVRGDVTLGFDFNTELLAKFINDITLPDYPGTDWQQIGTDIAFEAAGAALGAVPVAGPALGFLTGAAQTGYGSYQEIQKVTEQINSQVTKATEAAAKYKNSNWGTMKFDGNRDIVKINDFKIGIDSILLPKLPEGSNYFLTTETNGSLGGTYISIKDSNNHTEIIKHVAFIVNNYSIMLNPDNTAELTDVEFTNQLSDLLVGSEIGSYSKTSITGSSSADIKEGGFANDFINGMNGDDTIYGYYSNDLINGGNGNDTIYGGSGNNDAYLIYERSADNPDAPYLNDGNDIISGGVGDDTLYGESGDDFINGDAFTQSATGVTVAVGNGNDTLYGGSGNDTLMGGAGNDKLDGGIGADKMDGGLGDDTYIVDNKADTVSEGEGKAGGTDTVNSSVSFTLKASVEDLVLTGANSINGTGNYLDNSLSGNDGANTLYGLDGNDNLLGNGGNDRLEGGYGNDKLNGGEGNDLLIGGLGHDHFVFNTTLSLQNIDKIQDFRVTEDIIDLSRDIFTQFTATGAIAADNFVSGAGAIAHDSNDYLIYNTSTHVLSYDADGNAAGLPIDIALIGVSNLSYANIAIV